MKTVQLETVDQLVRLIEPDVERDAALGVEWLNGELGRSTMVLMGNSEEVVNEMIPTTQDREAGRVKEFLEREDQLNWMIEYNGKVVGSTWVDIEPTKNLLSPSVHIMIGDPDMRGKGVGLTTISAVLDYLKQAGHKTIYSRHIVSNDRADGLLKSLGFKDSGETYLENGVEFQNLELKV